MKYFWMLKVESGLHEGAAFKFDSDQVVTLGTSTDNDIVMVDECVKEHHCVIACHKKRLQVKSLSGSISEVVDQPGQEELAKKEFNVATNGSFNVGDVRIQCCLYTEKTQPSYWSRQTIQIALIGFLVATPLLAFNFFPADWSIVSKNHQVKGSQANQSQLLEENSMGSSKVVTKSQEYKDIAEEVREILRLSQIEAETRLVEEGTVEVKGYFGDETKFRQILGSRAIRDIDGLAKILEVNLNHDNKVPDLNITQSFRVVSGANSFLMSEDGSRYYPGAVFNNGYQLESVQHEPQLGYSVTVSKEGEEVKLLESELQQFLNPS